MKKSKKRTYEPPQLRVIEVLEGPEVLAIGCKLDSAGIAPGDMPCIANNCAQAGS